MEIVSDAQAMQERAAQWRREGHSVGLVATMGALHAGHMELVRGAREECERVCTSVFVNPTQFAPHEDLERYPRPFERDSTMLEQAGVDVLFAPTPEEMYGVATMEAWMHSAHATVEVARLGEVWEGAARPGHLRGVATIVAKLFNACGPTRAYFGEKDFQQLRVVQRMVDDLLFPVHIVAIPTMREPDGLALSSRNAYLSPEERNAAPALFRALQLGARLAREGERDVAALGRAMQHEIESDPNITLQYLTIVDRSSLEPLEVLEEPGQARTLVAAKLGQTRLIDNAPI
jgi:pantoate--beta-alanine ligase